MAGALGPAAVALAEDAERRIAFDGTGRYVDFFATPTADGAPAGFVRNGERVAVRPGQGEWLQVEARDGIWRWVPEALVHPPVPDRPLRIVDLADLGFEGTPVLDAPDDAARSLRFLPNGTVVAIVARRSYFLLAETPGRRLGWIVDLGLAEVPPDDGAAAPPPPLQR